MKRIKLSPDHFYVTLSDVPSGTPIFAVRDGKIKGMLVDERELNGSPKWILKIGGTCGSTGHYSTMEETLRASLNYYDYYVIDPEIKE